MKTFVELLYTRNDDYCVNICRDMRSKDGFNMIVEIWIKNHNSIWYSIQRCQLVVNPVEHVKEWIDNTQQFGLESHRPYSPGQACDGTISAGVVALFTDMCKKRGINPVKLWNAAYPDERPRLTKKELDEMKAFADWQGIAYPKHWNVVNIELLLESLHNANYHQLANVVSEELGLF